MIFPIPPTFWKGRPVMEPIKFSPPDIREEDIQSVIEAMRSGWITTGPKTKAFERDLADYCGAKRALCLNSATAALELSLRLLGIGEGDEVITSAYTYTASASVICHVGATPVLVDTEPNHPFPSARRIADAVTERTKAVILVDLAGVMADYDALFAALEEKSSLFTPANELQKNMGRIAVIADAAHSLGAESRGRKSGSVADLTCFSFHAVKNLTTAEGGAVLFGDLGGLPAEEHYQRMNLFSLHGQNKDALKKTQVGSWEYDILMPGYKCNMTDIAAAMGITQLARYDKMMARRHEIFERYQALLADTKVEFLSQKGENFCGSAHLAITRVPGLDVQARNELIIKMGEAGIPCNVHYKPLPLLTAYANLGFVPTNYPNAMAYYENEITLPLHTLLTDEQVTFIGKTYASLLK